MKNKTTLGASILLGGLLVLSVSDVFAHCEIPCGIYTDEMRMDMIEEDCKTIEKSMTKIVELSAAEEGNPNQLIRWVTNKEEHANKIQHVVTQYFMTQRIKPDADNYDKKVAVLHQMLVAAMKCKQTTDATHVASLRSLAGQFTELYFGKKAAASAEGAHAHGHEGHRH